MSSRYRFAIGFFLFSFACGSTIETDRVSQALQGRGSDSNTATGCSDLVKHQRGNIVVLPNGSDDTANLQCALSNAGEKTVRLRADRYRLSTVVATNFRGRLEGAGRESTILTNISRPVFVTPNFIDNGPSETNPWASMLAFVGGSFTISDLSISITGTAPTTGWTALGLGPIYAYAHGIVILGDNVARTADAVIERVGMQAEDAPADLFGVNLVNGVFYEGFIGPEFLPIGGSFTVRDSAFRRVASPTPVFNASGTTVEIENNLMEGGLLGGELYGGLGGSSYKFLNNEVQATLAGFDLYDACTASTSLCAVSNSTVRIADNQFFDQGIVIEGTLGSNVKCRIDDNEFQHVQLQLYLGPATHDCVARDINSYVDLGKNNHVTR